MRVPKVIRLLLPFVAVLAFAACGDEEESGSGVAGGGIDRAFVSEMIPHHEAAVEMAKMAQGRAQHPEIERLAAAIIRTQNAEIQRLKGLGARLEQAGVEEGDLGIPEDEMGMSHDSTMLETAKPFDREFIDMMIPHHQGAIRMARVELAEGENPEVKRLAQAIMDAQTKEIDEMNMWRVDWYGGLSPAGGVPAEEHH
jgi:uncharacterized protein (DUF305 family)